MSFGQSSQKLPVQACYLAIARILYLATLHKYEFMKKQIKTASDDKYHEVWPHCTNITKVKANLQPGHQKNCC